MLDNIFTKVLTKKAIPITPITKKDYPAWLETQSERVKQWLSFNQLKIESGACYFIPGAEGVPERLVLGRDNDKDYWSLGAVPPFARCGEFYLDVSGWLDEEIENAAIAWGLGSYQFLEYKKDKKKYSAKLFVKETLNFEHIESLLEAMYLIRDLINYPAEDLGPAELAEVVVSVASKFNAQVKQFVGDELLKHNFPSVHMVGRASARAPRLLEIKWGDEKCPKVALVGKGVCYDSGGLSLKPTVGMIDMKGDMGGVAHALAIAQMVMRAKLPICLHVVLPLVENLVSGLSYKPSDILRTRKGITVEIKNTDAEGRLLLADALALASENKPELIIDFATLTGAAVIALGEEISALYANNTKLAHDVFMSLRKVQEETWIMPLHKEYRYLLDSKIADMSNVSSRSPYGGSLTAALFLQEFVAPNIDWVHFDMHTINNRSRPGRPEGGEAGCVRGIFNYLKNKYCGE